MNTSKLGNIDLIGKFFSRENKYSFIILCLSFIISFSLISYINLNIGFIMSSDSHAYSRWADELIKLDFNLVNFYNQNTYYRPNYIYTIPVFLIALAKIIFGAEWQYAFIIFDLVLVLSSLVIFCKILKLLNVRLLVMALTMPVLATSVDLLTWPRYILSDTIFSFLVIISIYLTIKTIVSQSSNYYQIVILFVMFLTRPTSLPYIFSIISFMMIMKLKIEFKPKFILLFMIFLYVISPFMLATLNQIIETYFNINGDVLSWINSVKIGMIIHDRPETWINSPNTFLEIVNLYYTRILFFFTPYIKSFSLIHITLNLFHAVLICISVFIWLIFGKTFDIINKSIFLILLICVSVASFHSFTLIDYDWRYRYPIIMPLFIIIPVSLEILLKKIFSKF
mgnify:CR=1 FL=1|tara:strand:+ start:2517 stop:3704 length:1188 start_codon:yes stop_codon:yes gene_type:complete